MIPRSFGTHDGTFHADDVSACALLLTVGLIDRDKIFRTRDPQILKRCEYVCDVGGIYSAEAKRFDHHQVEYRGDLSSAGMIWGYLLDQKLITPPVYEHLNRSVIIGVDAHDNGRVLHEEGVCTFSHVIGSFVPMGGEGENEESLNNAFFIALEFATGCFKRFLARYEYTQCCKDQVAQVMKAQSELLIFDKAMPWQESFFELGGETHPGLFILMPTESHWKLRGIPPNRQDKMAVRLPLPAEWGGLREQELKKVSGIKGAIFCHKGLFISVWETKEDALEAAEYIMKKKRNK